MALDPTDPEGWARPRLPRGAAPRGAVLRAPTGPSARSGAAITPYGSRLPHPSSRCAGPKRSPWVAFHPRSAHAARIPRTTAFDGFQTSPSFRRVARCGLSLHLRSKAHRNRLHCGCAHLTVVYRAHVPDTHGDARCGNLAITVVPPVLSKFRLARPRGGMRGNHAYRRSPVMPLERRAAPVGAHAFERGTTWEMRTGTAS